MKTKRLLFYLIIIFLVTAFYAGCKEKPKNEKPAAAQLTEEQMVQRGNYLVATIGCGDCHSPKKMGPQGPEVIQELMLSGHPSDASLPPVDKNALKNGWILFPPDLTAAVGPWGISYGANLTSDPSGIGSWPEENFIRAMKKGKYMGVEGGRELLPPMPWQNFANGTDEDMKAIFAYLKTTKAVHNVVPLAVAPSDIK